MRRVTWACAVACVLGLAGPAASETAADTPTIAELVAPPRFFEPMLSPDGTRAIAREAAAGPPVPVLIDLATRARTPIALPAGNEAVWYNWSGPRLILGLRRQVAGKTIRHLAAVDPASGAVTELAGPNLPEGVLLHFDRDGRFVLLSASSAADPYPAVWRVDLADGALTLAVNPQPGVTEWQADSAGVVRAGAGERSGKRLMLYRTREGEPFQRASKRATASFDGLEQLVPVPGSDQGYAISAGAHGRAALFRYDFARERLGALVYANPEVDVEGFETRPDGGIAAVTFTDDRDETVWLDPAAAALQRRIDAALPGAVNGIVSATADKTRLIVASNSAKDPGSYYVFDAASGAATLLARTQAALAGRQLADMRPIRYTARDGLPIRGYLTLPAGRDARQLPLIVMPHGGPFARDFWGYDSWVQYLASKGYAVLQPNYRGSTGFGREFTEAGDGEWGRGMQRDLADGIAWLAAQGTIDPKRTCIMGASYGGYAAMWAAARETGTYRCAISYAGISDVRAQLDFDRKTFEHTGMWLAWRARIQGAAASLDSLSPLDAVKQMTMPILIAHGSADETVPVAQAKALHDALTRLGRDHDYRIYEGEGHNIEDPADAADFLTRVGAFLDLHNPA